MIDSKAEREHKKMRHVFNSYSRKFIRSKDYRRAHHSKKWYKAYVKELNDEFLEILYGQEKT